MDEIKLASGRRIYAHRGILGMTASGELELSQGYDGDVWVVGEEPYGPRDALTAEERAELATLMVARWRAFGELEAPPELVRCDLYRHGGNDELEHRRHASCVNPRPTGRR